MNKEMKKYYVPFAYERYGRMEVEATSREEAIDAAEAKLADMTLADMEALTDYLPGSDEIDYDGDVCDENGNIIEEDDFDDEEEE